MKGKDTYAIRRNLTDSVSDKWWKCILIKDKFNSVTAYRKYDRRKLIKEKIFNLQITNKRLRNGKKIAYQSEVCSDNRAKVVPG